MQRLIKFRAWDKIANKMYSPKSFKRRHYGLNYQTDSVELSFSGMEHAEQVLLMQYTGLKDRHGVEIYEGDIVRLTDDWDNESVHKVEYCAEYDYPAFDVKPHIDAESNGLSHFMATGEIEVIGNIWEHEELLSDS